MWLKQHRVIGCSIGSEDFNLVLASLSQNPNVPSPPTVATVPWTGWNAISFTYKNVEEKIFDYSNEYLKKIVE